MRVPVLAYHATNVSGNDYASNDHLAFAADLRLIDDLDLRIVPLQWVVEQVIGAADRDLAGCVALTCDDGSALDFSTSNTRNMACNAACTTACSISSPNAGLPHSPICI